MLNITFTVPGLIQPKQRPRAGRGGHFYTPQRTQDSERIVGLYAKLAMNGPPISGYCILHLKIIMEPPTSWSGKKKSLALEGNLFPSSGDADNRAKLLADAMNNIVYCDDKQIVRMIVTQLYGPVSQAIVTIAETNNLQELEQITLDILQGGRMVSENLVGRRI